MKITESKLRQFRSDYTKAMEALESKYGVMVDAGRITYTEDEFRFKTTVHASDPKPQLIENVQLADSNHIVLVGDTVMVDHKKAFGRKFRVIKVNRTRMVLEDLQSGGRVKAPIVLVKKLK